MSFRNRFFEENQPLHIISRAVEGRKIFENKEDCYRFIFQIFAANMGKPGLNLRREDIIGAAKLLLHSKEMSDKLVIIEHPPLVHILDFSLVVNHYHFYLMTNIENGIPRFMQKLNGGFAMYFNLKYGRQGTLFGRRYKSVPVKTEFQSDAVSRYVSIINPLDLYQPGWREEGLDNWEEAFDFLENYQFSSFPDKIGKRNSKLLAPKEVLERIGLSLSLDENDYRLFVEDFLKQNLFSISPFFLE